MRRFSAPSKKILGIGNALLDTLVRIPDESLLAKLGLTKGCMTLLAPEQCQKIVLQIADRERTDEVGGSAANTIRGIAALGAPCGYIGKVGPDAAGSIFRGNLSDLGIASQLMQGDQPSGRCISFITPDGERTMATYLGAAADLTANEISPSLFRGYDYLHIEGYLVQNQEMIERALSLAKDAGLCISLDLSSPNVVNANLEFLREMASFYVDIILANEEEATAFAKTVTPREALNVLASYCKIAVVKLGASGSLIAYQNTRYLIPAREANPVDTTGAGDLYAAGFLYGTARGLGLENCGKIATLLASHVIGIIGASIPAAEWPEIRAAIRKMEAD